MAKNGETPILFNSEMVRAILDGCKTQTRRIIKPQPHYYKSGWFYKYRKYNSVWIGDTFPIERWKFENMLPYCPYGQVGDLLWVKETFWYCCDGCKIPFYKADKDILEDQDLYVGGVCHPREGAKWKSPRFMPKWAARVWLEITEIRVERVQDITSGDAAKEGIEQWGTDAHMKGKFLRFWDSINAKRGCGWDENPWVWAISFKRIREMP